MRITLMIPDDIKDRRVKECLEELTMQLNAALSETDRKIQDIRSEKNGR
jgi:hypothetical protein